MKQTLLLLICLLPSLVLAQIRITGTVYDEDNIALEGASVYINNTSVGTTTDDEGGFELNVNKGAYQLVVSFIGYQTKTYSLNTDAYKKPIDFKLQPKTTVLDEIVIKKRKRMSRSKRGAYLRKFQKAFFGKSKFGQECKVLNEQVLKYDVTGKNDMFEVSASEPIKIMNPELGYLIYYDLLHFELTPASVTYFGHARYEKISDSKELIKKWEQNRLKAYKGSKMHFLRSVMNEEVKEQGFTVDIVQRVPHPKRPSNKKILEAYDYLRKNVALQRNPFGNTAEVNQKITEYQTILELAKLPEFVDKTVEKNVGLLKYGIVLNSEVYLQFKNALRITYRDEKPDKNYKTKKGGSKYQVSTIKLYKKYTKIHKSGVFAKPFDVFLQGYWAFEKVGDALPLDYKPTYKFKSMR